MEIENEEKLGLSIEADVNALSSRERDLGFCLALAAQHCSDLEAKRMLGKVKERLSKKCLSEELLDRETQHCFDL
eukprot:1149413-Pelagomonas_calceolata.AAC.11